MNEFAGKKVLITGATGLIGTNLTEKLLKAGASVIVLGRTEEKLKKVFNHLMNDAGLSLAASNIASEFPGLKDIDYIFHAASPISSSEIRSLPVDTISANIDGTRNCLEFLRKQGRGRLIVFSSATVYGNYNLLEDITVTEEMTDKADALHTPNTPYSESKRMIEVLARAYGIQYSVDSVIVRIGYVYGFTDPKPNTAFYEFIGKANRGENIILNNSGMGRRDNIYVDDVVNGLMIVAAKGTGGVAYNLSSNGDLGNFKAIDEIAEIIAMKTGVRAIVKPIEGHRMPGMKMDNTKAKELGWKIEVGIEDGISRTINQYKVKNG